LASNYATISPTSTGVLMWRLSPLARQLASSLLEIFSLPSVDSDHPDLATAKALYADLMSTPPPPKIEAKLPGLCWDRIWGRLTTPGIFPALVDIGFATLHNILPIQIRRHRLCLAASPACTRCGVAFETVLHFFTQCPRVSDAWECLTLAASTALGGPINNLHLLLLNLPPFTFHEQAVVLAVLAHIDLAWSSRDTAYPLPIPALVAHVKFFAHGHLRPLFSL
jgi:hypothetical protein